MNTASIHQGEGTGAYVAFPGKHSNSASCPARRLMVERDTMLARLLPQGDDALIAHELARMGHQTPEALLGEDDRRLVWKCIGVPRATATVLLDWLQQQGPGYWGYSTAGAEAATRDLLWGGPATLIRQIRQAQQAALQPVVVALEQAMQLRERWTAQ